jgi:beta-glucosidase
MDERTLHEIYLAPFHDALVGAHAWTLMVALNQLNGVWMADDGPLLTGLVKGEWQWDGLAISDWGSLHDTAGAANAGTDIEMPQPQFFAPDALTAALKAGTVSQAVIDDKVRRVLRVMARTGLLDPPPGTPRPPILGESEGTGSSPAPPGLGAGGASGAGGADAAVNSPAHQRLALQVAQEGIILLKNANGVLPLDRRALHSIAVIGPNAADTQLGGRWSADTTPYFRVSVLDGIRKAAGPGVRVQSAEGCPRFDAGNPALLGEAVTLASHADVAVVVVGTDNTYEDPPDIHLPGDQEALIAAVAAVNPRTVVVLNQGTPVLMDWLNKVPGVLESWYAGQSQGDAVAQILFGDVDPSGKLTETIGARREDYSDYGFYPGADRVMTYGEGIYVGYRHFDKAHIAPLFPFGYGLSYTTFEYGGLKVGRVFRHSQPLLVHLTVTNTGRRAGAEVVQLYVHPLDPAVDRPVRELEGFARVTLPPGGQAPVTIPLGLSAFSYWDTSHHLWHADPGRYAIEVGASSRDIRLRSTVRL